MRTALSVALLLVVIGGLTARAVSLMNVPGMPNDNQWAMQDFRDAVYYPVVSLLHGTNPYDSAAYLEQYPVLQLFPPYSPLTLVLHLPFGLMPPGLAQGAFFGFSILLTLVLAAITLHIVGVRPTVAAVSLLAAAVLATRPGHWNLLLGQTTVELVLAVYLAVYLGRRHSFAAGLALAVASTKPTFGVPLVLLMLGDRLRRPVTIGIVLAAVLSLAPVVVLVHAAGGLAPFVQSIVAGYAGVSEDFSSNPVISPVRIDAVALICRILGEPIGPWGELGVFVVFVLVAVVAIRRARQTAAGRGTDVYCLSIVSIAILVSSYQLTYSALILVLPATALVLDRWVPEQLAPGPGVRWVLLLLLAVPAANYLASFSFMSHLQTGGPPWLVLSSVNSVAMVTVFAIYVGVAFRRPPTTVKEGARP